MLKAKHIVDKTYVALMLRHVMLLQECGNLCESKENFNLKYGNSVFKVGSPEIGASNKVSLSA